MCKTKSVMMIGGGVQEIKAVEIAQSSGYKVIVTDRNPDAPCFPFADYTAVIDGRDIEGLISYTLLKREKLNISGVFTLTELVTSVAAVASACDLPGVSLQSAVACQNKQLCKEVWLKNGISTPKGKVVKTAEETKLFFDELNHRAFIKPLVGFGGIGACRILSVDDIDKVFLDNNDQELLMEELVVGTMHDVNGLIDINGIFHPLGIVDRFFIDNYPVEKEIRTPSELTQLKQKELYELLEKSVKSLGIKWGPVKGDAVLSRGIMKMLEVAPRLHGPKSSLYLLPYSGLNCLEYALDTITNTNEIDNFRVKQNMFSVCTAILPVPGSLFDDSRVSEVRQIKGIVDTLIFSKRGFVIKEYRNSTHVPGYILSTGKNLGECQKSLKKAKKMLGL